MALVIPLSSPAAILGQLHTYVRPHTNPYMSFREEAGSQVQLECDFVYEMVSPECTSSVYLDRLFSFHPRALFSLCLLIIR